MLFPARRSRGEASRSIGIELYDTGFSNTAYPRKADRMNCKSLPTALLRFLTQRCLVLQGMQ